MNCVVVMRVATAAIAACELAYRHSGTVVAFVTKAASLPSFKWDGAPAKVELQTDDPNPNAQHELPDVRFELEQIKEKLQTVGRVRIIIEIEPATTNTTEATQ